MTKSIYGETFSLWRAGCPAPWHDYTHHAFVEGLRDGSLPRAAFLHYLVQDYVFLVHFARAWSLAVVKADTMEEMKTCSGIVNSLVAHEMALHVKTCAAAGIDEATLFTASEEIENLAYTRFVMDAGLHGDFLDLVAALAPCCFRLWRNRHAPRGDSRQRHTLCGLDRHLCRYGNIRTASHRLA